MKTNLERFGKLVAWESRDGKDIIIETEKGDPSMRLDHDDVNHRQVEDFADALVKLWNEQRGQRKMPRNTWKPSTKTEP